MVGYVVNVHDAVNFDIDLLLPDELITRYQNVITNQYTYSRGNEEVTGTTFRCRLKGIGINNQIVRRNPTSSYDEIDSSLRRRNYETSKRRPNRKILSPALREATISMIRQFDRFNGWVLCTISDVDVYRRLLITLYDPISKRDLREILFAEPTGSFSPYLLDPRGSPDPNQEELSSDSSDLSDLSPLSEEEGLVVHGEKIKDVATQTCFRYSGAPLG